MVEVKMELVVELIAEQETLETELGEAELRETQVTELRLAGQLTELTTEQEPELVIVVTVVVKVELVVE